jgi:aspartate-semialdehyde dehydrogenase
MMRAPVTIGSAMPVAVPPWSEPRAVGATGAGARDTHDASAPTAITDDAILAMRAAGTEASYPIRTRPGFSRVTQRHANRPGMSFVVAVVGATGAVGREMLRTLEQRRFPVKRVVALASKRSAGVELPFAGGGVVVEELGPGSFAGVEIALFSAGASVAREYGPIAAKAGATVIDNSSAWRMDADVPLVVPEVNLAEANKRPRGIIANPNCATIQMVVALKPLHDAARLKHIVVSTYQSTSGKGHAAVEEMLAQSRAVLAGETPESKVFPGTIAFNTLFDWKPGDTDWSEEEIKIIQETRKIFGDESIGVTPTTVRVPVVAGHGEAVHVQFHRPMSATEAKALLAKAEGVVLMDGAYAPGKHPQAIHAAGTDPVYVGRVRDDFAVPGAINMWVVSDNLRKGAALNAVQIAERVFVR